MLENIKAILLLVFNFVKVVSPGITGCALLWVGNPPAIVAGIMLLIAEVLFCIGFYLLIIRDGMGMMDVDGYFDAVDSGEGNVDDFIK